MVNGKAFLRIFFLSIALAAAACATSKPSHFYTLDSVAVASGAPPVRLAVMVGPVTIPETVDRPQMVVQVAPNRVDVDEFNRWAAPLSDNIARAVAGDLAVLLGTPDVAVMPLADFDPAYRVAIDVQRFKSIRGQATEIVAVWTVRDAAGGKSIRGRTVARETVEGKGFGELAAAGSQALAKISADIANAIRQQMHQTTKLKTAHPRKTKNV